MSASELGKQAEQLEAWGEAQKSKLAAVQKRVAGYLTQINRAHEIVRETEAALKAVREEIAGSLHEYEDKMQTAIGMSVDLRKELARLEAIQTEAQEAMTRGETQRASELTGEVSRQHDALEPAFNNVNVEIGAATRLVASINAAGKRADLLARPELAKRKGRRRKGETTAPAGPSPGNWSFRKQR